MAQALRFIEANKLMFSLPEHAARLRVEVEDEFCLIDAIIRRPFPMSRPDSFLSIQNSKGDEVGMIRSLDDLDHESRKLVEREMDRRYFTPKILQLKSLKQDGGMWTFEVSTSRGPCTFYVRNWRDSSHEVSPGRFIIQSVDGQRFEVPDFDALDQRSQILIEQLF
ncbi:MAG: DUF1854 domain-containing protein [Fimbriimonadaceae bacterium]